MRVMVTGGAGFLGSHVVVRLLEANHEVTVVDNLSTGTLANLHPDAHFIRYDIRSDLTEVFRQTRPEAVLHLAAQTSVPKSLANPLEDLTTNVFGTASILLSASKAGVRKVVSISSAAVYGHPVALPVSENSTVQARSPYGLSKLTGERYVQMLGDLSGVAYTVIRPANIYGPRQVAGGEGAVVPSFLEAFLNGKDPVIHGDGLQTRDFVYVTDVSEAMVTALNRADGLILNIGSGSSTAVLTLWEELARLVDWKRTPVHTGARDGDIRHSTLDILAAQKHLEWVPRVQLSEGLASTVLWWQAQAVAATTQ